MKNFLQNILVIILVFLVGFLGFFAYKSATDRLVFAFKHQENQIGNNLVITFDRPGKLSKIIPSGTILDISAIKKSIYYNDKKLTEEEIENFEIKHTFDSVKISYKNFVDGDTIRISSLDYNSLKNTPYSIPEDILFTYNSQNFEDFKISEISEPKDGKFEIILQNENIKISDISWYEFYPENENCFDNEILWDSSNYKKINPENIEKNNEKYIVKIPYKSNSKNQCLIAGYGNKILNIINRNIENFSIEGELTKSLTPYNDLKSQISFFSNSPLSTNISKKSLLNKISISPNIEINEENIEIFKDKITIIGDFKYSTEYTVHLTDIEDIYGRKISYLFNFTPENSPFFAIKLNSENKNIFFSKDEIFTKILASNTDKKNFEIKICRLDSSSWYSFSKIINEKSKLNYDKIFEILNSEKTSNCKKTEINLSENSMISEFSLQKIFDSEFNDGLYVLNLRNQEDTNIFENFIEPQIFSITKNKIILTNFEDNNSEIRVINSENPLPVANSSIEISGFISDDLNSDSHYSTGQTIGNTNENGTLKIENIKNFGNSGIIFSRINGELAFLEFDLKDQNLEKQNNFQILTDKEKYHPNENVKIFTFINNFYKNNNSLILKITDDYGISHYNSIVKIGESKNFSIDFNLPNETGNFIFTIENEKNNEILAKKIIKSQEENIKNFEILADFRAIDAQNGIPQNIRKIKNTDEKNPWYEHIFTTPITIESIIRIKDNNGNLIKNSHFNYLIKKIQNNETEIIKEGKGIIGSDGIAYIRENDNFSTYHNDVKYILDISIFDTIIDENIIKSFELNLQIPDEYKIFDDSKNIISTFEKNIFEKGENIKISSEIQKYGENIFNYEIISQDNSIYSSGILNQNIEISSENLESGKYTFKSFPKFEYTDKIPEKMIFQKNFFIQNENEIKVKNLEFFTDKNIYNTGDSIFINIIPKNKNTTLFLSNLENIFPSQIIKTENQIAKLEFKIPKNYIKNNLNFEISYLKNKKIQKINFTIPINHNFNYENFLNINDFDNGKNIEINLENEKLTNFSHYILSIFDNEKNIFTNFSELKNNKINQKIPELKPGNYNLQLILVRPDLNYTIQNKNFSIKSNFKINHNIPSHLYQGDKTDFKIDFFNNSDTISYSDVILEIGKDNPEIFTGSIISNIYTTGSITFPVKINSNLLGEGPYKIIFKKNNEIIGTENGSFNILEIPSNGLSNNIVGYTTGSIEFFISNLDMFDNTKSNIEILVGNDTQIITNKIITDLKNFLKSDFSEELDFLILKAKLNPENKNEIQNINIEFEKFLKNQSLEKWRKFYKMSNFKILENILKIQEIQKLGIKTEGKFDLEAKNFIKNINFDELDIIGKINYLEINYNFYNEIDSKKIEELLNLDLNFADYNRILEFSKKINHNIEDKIFEKINLFFDEKNSKISDKIAFLKILLKYNKKDLFAKNLEKFNLENLSKLPNFDEKKEAILFLIEYNKTLNPKNTKISIFSDGIAGSTDLTNKKNLQNWTIEKSKIHGNISLKTDNPIFYVFNENNFLNTPALFPAKISENLKISKKIFFVNENAGQDGNGEYFVTERMENGDFFQTGKLYKITVEVDILKNGNFDEKNIQIRHFLPSSADIFLKEKTKSRIIKKQGNEILLDFSDFDDKIEFSYYFRPKNSGSFLFPASFAYFKENRATYSNDSHSYLHFQ